MANPTICPQCFERVYADGHGKLYEDYFLRYMHRCHKGMHWHLHSHDDDFMPITRTNAGVEVKSRQIEKKLNKMAGF